VRIPKTVSKLRRILSKFSTILTKKEREYLLKLEIRSSNFYELPKIHKSRQIKYGIQGKKSTYVKLPKPDDLKPRPLIASPDHAALHSNLLDIILKPLCTEVPCFARDDMDFLHYIPNTVKEDTTPASFDVTSLYANIPQVLKLSRFGRISMEIKLILDSPNILFFKDWI
jgi:hypothetical protein